MRVSARNGVTAVGQELLCIYNKYRFTLEDSKTTNKGAKRKCSFCGRPENEVGGSIECRLKGVRRLFEAIVRGAGHFSTDVSPLSGLFAYIRAFEGKDRKPDLLFYL